jgi:Outer membrane protein beta-barrel domain
MRLFFLVLFVCGLLLLAVPQAAAQDNAEVFGGYSLVHANFPVTTIPVTCPAPPCLQSTNNRQPNMSGWEVAGTFKPVPWFGITGDFSSHYGTIRGASARMQNYLFGPKLEWHAPVSPFFHALVGVSHETINNGPIVNGLITVPRARTDVAAVLGVGIDIKLVPYLAFRPIQFDYLLTRFANSTQSNARVSAGLVLRF